MFKSLFDAAGPCAGGGVGALETSGDTGADGTKRPPGGMRCPVKAGEGEGIGSGPGSAGGAEGTGLGLTGLSLGSAATAGCGG